MGKVEEKIKAKAKKADELEREYIDTLHWCVDQIDNAIAELVKARTEILEATKDHLTEIAAEMRNL